MLEKPKQSNKLPRILALGAALLGLSLVYLFQNFSYAQQLMDWWPGHLELHPYTVFIINKAIRYLLNDTFCLLIIYALFVERRYVMLGVIVEVVGLVLILPLYFVFKLSFEGDTELSSPLFSFVHRLIVNPTLMILLIVGLLLQRQGKLTNNH